jgi:predicted AAA+ superfamily ATPase
MQRLLLNELIKWKNKKDRRPLIIKGVRQCGKTYLLKEFGAKYYRDVAYFNFEGNAPLCERFKADLDVERIITELSVLHKKPIRPDETLIIFDEIQFCNEALTALKYFYENASSYHIVSAGSLLGIALSKPLSFPVGKVDFLTLRPMSYYEFLLAHGEAMLCEHLQKLAPAEKISELFAEKLENYLRRYYITGGMPEAVAVWLETNDLSAVESVQQKILDSYELDFAKHAPPKDFPRLSLIWNSIPAQLAKEHGKFIFSKVKPGLRAKDLEDALQWLISAGLVFKVSKIGKPFMPLASYADQNYFKLYMVDIGLLRKMSKLPPEALLTRTDMFKEFKGALTENYALCEIVNLQGDAPYYWKSGNTAEVDFVAQFGMDIVPIEVKSGRNDKSRSLTEYRKKYTPRVSVKVSMNAAGGGEVRNIPLYMLWKMPGIIETSG